MNSSDFKRVYREIRNNVKLIIVLVVVFAGIFFLYSYMNLEKDKIEPTYKQTLKVYIEENEKHSIYSDTAVAVELVLSDDVIDRIIESRNLDLEKEEVYELLFVKPYVDSNTLEIIALCETAELAEELISGCEEIVVSEIQKELEPETCKILSKSSDSEKVTVESKGETVIRDNNLSGIDQYYVSPYTEVVVDRTAPIKMALAGTVIGLFIGCCIVVCIPVISPKLKYPEVIKARMDIKTLIAYKSGDQSGDINDRLISTLKGDTVGILDFAGGETINNIIDNIREHYEKQGSTCNIIDPAQETMKSVKNDETKRIIRCEQGKAGEGIISLISASDTVLVAIKYNDMPESKLRKVVNLAEDFGKRIDGIIFMDVPGNIIGIEDEFFGMLK